MIFILAVLLVLSCYSAKVARTGQFFEDYLSKSNTTAINGIFVVLVFLCHFYSYVSFGTTFIDRSFVNFVQYLGQLVVVTFFFFSGYGMIYSISKKGMPYVKKIPMTRFLRVLLHFDIAIALFMIMNLFLGHKFPLYYNLLSLIAWESIGNSNWFIFATLCLYLIVFVSFIICRCNKYIGTSVAIALTAVLIFLLIKANKPTFFYNTIFCYPLGMVYGLFKDKIDKIVMKKDWIYLCFLVIAVAGFIIFKYFGFFYPAAVFFVFSIVFLSMKVRLNNVFLQFTGKRVFSIYIIQRIPMAIFKYFGLTAHRYIFFAVTFTLTLLMAYAFDKLISLLDKKLFDR